MRVCASDSWLWAVPGVAAKDASSVVGLNPYKTRLEVWEEKRMRVVELEQSSPAWLAWRKTGIGASESAAVVGLNPYKSRLTLWREKRGIASEDGGNFHTARGHRLEPRARQLYEDLMGWSMTPVCAVHDEHDWLKASLDGIRGDGKVVLEIKAPGVRNHERHLSGDIPEYYECQMQHQLLVAAPGAKVVHFVSYCPDHPTKPFHLIPVYPRPDFQQDLLACLSMFWDMVQEGIEPPA